MIGGGCWLLIEGMVSARGQTRQVDKEGEE